jgi:hypothetical protein
MLEEHYTREGNKMLVAEMEDSHLQNLVKLRIAQLGKLQSQMSENPAMSEFQSRLYGVETVDVKAAARESRNIIKGLYPYLAELYLRGLTDLVEPLRKVIGRDSQLVVGGLFLPANVADNESLDIDQILGNFGLDSNPFVQSALSKAHTSK